MNAGKGRQEGYSDSIAPQMDTEYARKPASTSTLFGLIIIDLLYNQKMALFLLILIIVSASSILVTTQQIRKQLFEQEQLMLENGVLESERRNLVIEENVLADPKRVENKARSQLEMNYVTPEDETVIVIKSK